ncbi:diguanylate cyclase domain-containing protein [Pseudoroseomonas wenyumeiae]
MHQHLQIAFDRMPFPALVLNSDLTILAFNSAFERLTILDRRVIGRPSYEVLPGSDEAQTKLIRQSFNRVMRTGKPDHIPYLQYAVRAPGKAELEERYWSVSNIPLYGPDDSLQGLLHCPTEITELVQLRHANQSMQSSALDEETRGDLQRWTQNLQGILRNERERLHQLFQQAPGFICILQGPNHVFELANDAYYQLVGHRQIIGHPLGEVLPEVIAQGFLNKLDRVFATGEPFIGRAMPIELQRFAGGDLELRYIDLIYQPMLDADRRVTGIFVQGNDVTEAYTLAQEVTYQAAHDSLTGLHNRRGFARQTDRIQGAGPHALLYMDIDHLKIVNDRCGHGAGDELLLMVAEALQAQCGEQDLLARLGGDEFALIRRNCGLQSALQFAERLRAAVKAIAFFWQDQRYGVTLSVGVVSFGCAERLTFEDALALADAACFLAKEKGRNRVQACLPSDNEIRQRQHDMDNVTRLKEAMREDRLLLYGQRIMGLRGDGDSVFCEVLARLRDQDGTIIEPGASFRLLSASV